MNLADRRGLFSDKRAEGKETSRWDLALKLGKSGLWRRKKCGNFYTPAAGNDDELISFLKMFGGGDRIEVVGREELQEVGVCHIEPACEYCFSVVLWHRK